MNSGYIIIKDDISSKINSNESGTINYKGAYDYALEVFRSGKIALLSLTIEGASSLQTITQVGSEPMIAWFFVSAAGEITISFNKETPDAFVISVVKGA